jgi:hypothetical protein
MSNSNTRAQVMIPSCMRGTALAALALVAALAGGCTDQPTAATGPSPGGNSGPVMGAIDVALAVPPSFQVATVNYKLTNTGYTKSGSLDVSQTQTISAVLGGIPAGAGYTLALTASDTAQKFTGCAGSSPVTVVGGAITPVSVAVDCHLPQAALTTSPAVPVPMPAVVLLAVGLVAAGLLTSGRRRDQRSVRRQ